MYCYLCEDYIGILTTGRYCEVCRRTKNIQRCYGKEEVLKILEDVCLRDSDKRDNKISHAVKSHDILEIECLAPKQQ